MPVFGGGRGTGWVLLRDLLRRGESFGQCYERKDDSTGSDGKLGME